jgi:site-specific recombinase XerD
MSDGCSIALVDAGRRRPCPASMPVVRRATRGWGIRRIRGTSRRSSPSCTPTATARTPAARGLIVILWRAGLRIQEALSLAESGLDHRRGALLVRRGRGGRRPEVGLDHWGWDELHPWLELRAELPVGPLFWVINGSMRGHHWSSAAVRADMRRTAVAADVRRRFAPHQLRHAHAVQLAREGVPPIVIQRQLGHSNLGITSIYLQGIDNAEIIETVHGRRAPMIPVSTSLPL